MTGCLNNDVRYIKVKLKVPEEYLQPCPANYSNITPAGVIDELSKVVECERADKVKIDTWNNKEAR